MVMGLITLKSITKLNKIIELMQFIDNFFYGIISQKGDIKSDESRTI